MKHYSLEDFPEVDSLYRVVNMCARRANQVNKPDSRPLVPVDSKKPTIIALEEVIEGKVSYRTGEGAEEDDYEIG